MKCLQKPDLILFGFEHEIEAALAVYPEAADKGVEVTEKGLILKPAKPPIAAKIAA